jgi:hypothetical protein
LKFEQKEGTMRPTILKLSLSVSLALCSGVPLFHQASTAAKNDQAAIVTFAQAAAMRALNFRQGDAASLTRAQADFTAEGWKDFMKHMEGFLDPKGAPTFSSSFVPTKEAVMVGKENGIIHLEILGTLKQTQNQSATTYRAAIEVRAAGMPPRIQLLEQTTCGGASTACQ